MVNFIAASVAVVAAAALASAASAKALQMSDAMQMVHALGFPTKLSRSLVVLLMVAEAGAALALLLGRPAEAAVDIAFLGMTFAFAGSYVYLRNLDVRCACFGAPSGGKLGGRQVLALPLWLAAAYATSTVPAASYESRIRIGVATASVLTVWRAICCARGFRRARLDRHALAGGV